MTHTLKRSRRDKIIGGVCGGLGDYLDVDPVIIRVAVAIVALSTLYGALAYIVAMIVIPKEEMVPFDEQDVTEKRKYASSNRYLPGLILIVIGVIMMAAQFGYLLNWSMFFAIALIALGLYMIYRYFWRNNIEKNNHQSMNNGKVENGGSSL